MNDATPPPIFRSAVLAVAGPVLSRLPAADPNDGWEVEDECNSPEAETATEVRCWSPELLVANVPDYADSQQPQSVDTGGNTANQLDSPVAAVPKEQADAIRSAVRAAFADDPDTAERVAECESGMGSDPRTYDLEAENGGVMQLSKATWAPYFLSKYGWTWAQVVLDLDTHLKAAREVYERAGGSWSPWACW